MKETRSFWKMGWHFLVTKADLRVALLGVVGAMGTMTATSQGAAEVSPLPPLPTPAVKRAVAVEAELFDPGAVRLLESPFKEAMETDEAYLLRLDPNRFVARFRKEAGLPEKAKGYDGWESGSAAGHCAGHYLSACSQMYRATGEARMLERVNLMVDNLAEAQKANGNGYLMATPGGKKGYEEMAAGILRRDGGTLNGLWVPWYMVHKVMAGLYDAYDLCGNVKAKEVLINMTDWCDRVVGRLDDAKMQEMLTVEHGGMAEVLANVYALTGNPRHLALAKKFCDHRLFDPIAAGKDVLDGYHANTQIPKFVGYQRIYELTGETPWGAAASNFWTFVARDRSFANGGNSVGECFFPRDQFEKAMHSVAGPESCNTYNILKLTRHVFTQKPDAVKMDFYERGLYNHMLISQHPKTGGFCYYIPLLPGAYRPYSNDFLTTDAGDFQCCVGTGMENHALYGTMIYAHKGDRLWVNLFIPSELNWREEGVSVTQATTFPTEPRTKLQFKLAGSKQFTVAVRYPGWVAPGAFKLAVNGQDVPTNARPGDYAEVTRQWNDGDTLAVELPMQITTVMLPNSASYAAITDGPILLAAKLGRDILTDSDFQRHDRMDEKKRLPKAQTPVIIVPAAEIPSHLEAVPGDPLTFKTKGLFAPADLTLVPFYRVYDERYSVYSKLTTRAAWEEELRQTAAAEQRERELTARTVDQVFPGEQQPEIDHQEKSERSQTGRAGTGNVGFRHATDGGWFSYEMKVDPEVPMTLMCTYWGSDGAGREFDVLVDGTVIATERLKAKNPDHFIDETYPIPAELTRGKKSVLVKFQAKPGMTAGGLFGCRMLKGKPEDQRQLSAAEQRERELMARTVDQVSPGEQQPEVDHQAKSERSQTGRAGTGNVGFRHATDGGWFSYEMKVDPEVPMTLMCTYWGDDGAGREFDVLVDGTVIATERLSAKKPGQFIDETYPIPTELTRGKKSVLVKFQAKPRMTAGGLFGCKMVK